VKSTGDKVINNRISGGSVILSVGISLDAYGSVTGAIVTGNTICAINPISGTAGNTVNNNTMSTSDCPTYF
jgi:hypothetical protein